MKKIETTTTNKERCYVRNKDIIKLYNHCKKISFLKNVEEYTIEDFLVKFNYSKKIKNLITSSIYLLPLNQYI